MAIITNSKYQTSAQYPQTPIPVVRNRLTAKAIEVVRAIVADNTNRMKGYKQDIQLLGSGVFYSNEYFERLQAPIKKLGSGIFFEKRNVFYHGRAPVNILTC